MNILLIGGGGREHAILKKLRENPLVETVWVMPGNGGMEGEAILVPGAAGDIEAIAAFAKANPVDFAVVAPDDPLVLGVADRLRALGIPTFGPGKDAAIIEGSKAFAKAFMQRHNIPTAAYTVCDTFESAKAALDFAEYPLVVKADGLALGKGVIIAANKEEALKAAEEMMVEKRFGESGARVVLEEFLTGPEVSVLAFTDGKAIVPMVSSMDHKRAFDGDTGPNTGGMGAIAPNPFYTEALAERCMREIFLPTIEGLYEEGRMFRGCLYFGLMLTQKGPKVIEYNCRFGDPETQAVLPLLKTDLLTVMQAVEDGRLGETQVEFQPGAACCVVLAAKGYPGAYEKGLALTVAGAERMPGVFVYHAGTKKENGQFVSSGGRVIGVTALGATTREAVERAYCAADAVGFPGGYCRRDIGKRAIRGEA